MATIPRSFVDNFTKAVNALSDDAKEKLAKALEKVDASVTFDELLEIMEALLGPYTESAAAVAATFYDGLREWFGISDGFYAVSEGMRQPYITSGTVNKVMEGKSAVRLSDEMQMALLNQLDYEIRRTANITIERNAKRDPLKPKWARVPEVTVTTYAPWSKGRGVTHNKFLAMTGTCMFCTMLASRGFVYHSADTASHAHPDCNCRIVPSWDKNKPSVEGYDPDKYYDMWKHPEKYEQGEPLAEKMRERQSLASMPFKKASTMQEATERMSAYVDTSAYKSKVDTKGMDIDAANSMLKSLDAVYGAYDVEKLHSIQRMNKRSNAFRNTQAEAAYQWLIGDLYYNADFVKTKKAMITHREEGKALTAQVLGGDFDAYIAKNAGNASKVRYATALRDTKRAAVAQSYDNFEEVIYAHELGHMLDDKAFHKVKGFDRAASREEFAGNISAYATASTQEYIAESFAAFYVGETEILDPALVRIFEEAMA